jgi:Na+/alanine symporter
VLPYKCFFLFIAILGPMIPLTNSRLSAVTDFGTGLMLWANLLIVLPLSYLAIRAYRDYFRRLDAGEFTPHEPNSVTDLVEDHGSNR